MKGNSIFRFAETGGNMLCQAANDGGSGNNGGNNTHMEGWSDKKEHIHHYIYKTIYGPYGSYTGYVECLYCENDKYWGYVIPTGGGYGYADWNGDGYADRYNPYDKYHMYGQYGKYGYGGKQEGYGYGGKGGSGGKGSGEGYGYGEGYDGSDPDGFPTTGEKFEVGTETKETPTPLTQKKYDKIVDKFLEDKDAKIFGLFLKGKTITVEYNVEKSKGFPGYFYKDTNTIALGVGAKDYTLNKEMFHAVDVPLQDDDYRGNAEIAEVLFALDRGYPVDRESKYYFTFLKSEIDRLDDLKIPANEIMSWIDPDIWKKAEEARKAENPEAYGDERMKYDKDLFNPAAYLEIKKAYENYSNRDLQDIPPVDINKIPFYNGAY